MHPRHIFAALRGDSSCNLEATLMGQQSILGPHRRLSQLVNFRAVGSVLSLVLFSSTIRSQTIATTVPLLLPSAIAFDSQGNFYIAEKARHVIDKIDTSGKISSVAGTGTQGFFGDGGRGTESQIDSPQGLALDSSNHLYIADTHNNRIRQLDLASGLITTVAGGDAGFSGDDGPATAALLNQPTAIAVDSTGSLYIADSLNHRIRRIDSAGMITTVAGNGREGFAGDGGLATSAALDSPSGLAVDANRNLYIADTHNNRIRRVDAQTGLVSSMAGTGVLGRAGDGALATGAALALPRGLAIDTDGNLYLADVGNNSVRRIDSKTGVITVIAGNNVQGFSGDGGPPTQASLDAPGSVVISPSSLVVVADTGNQRVREISTASSLSTIAGIGTITPGVLALTGPAVTTYGTGRLTATFTTTTSMPGSVTFLDRTLFGTAVVGSVNIVSNVAALDLSTFSAGEHSFTATYAGDPSHNSAQSPTLAVSITPLLITATVTPSSLLYGQSLPTLIGVLSGVLSKDQGNIAVSLTTMASTLSSVGSYPITGALSGSAAGNYSLGALPALTISPTPTHVSLTAPPANVDTTQSIALTAHVLSETTGSPSGNITLLDGGIPQMAAQLTSSGDATLTLSSLSPGAHNLSAVYGGDTNFRTSESATYSVLVTSIGGATDFSLATSGASSLSASPGTSVNFSFTAEVQGTGSLSGPITLTVSGLPPFATASFNPTFIPPGASATPFTLTVNIAKSNLYRTGLPSSPMILTILLLPLFTRRAYKVRAWPVPVAFLFLCLGLSGCGDRVYRGAQSSAAQSYTVTVTGTASSPSGGVLQHSAHATLILQQN